MRRPWIKIEVATPDKPEICTIANRLKMDEDMVVGKLVRFWAWLAQNQVAGSNLGVTMDFIDRLVGRKGFAAALCHAGWLAEKDGQLSIPNFDRHNSNLARTRALTKQRVERHRKTVVQKAPKRSLPSHASVEEVAAEEESYPDAEAQDVSSTQTPQPPAPASSIEAAPEPVSAEAEEVLQVEPPTPFAEEDSSESSPEESGLEESADESSDELSINALPTFNALQSESVVEKVMQPDEVMQEDVTEPPLPAEPEKPAKKVEEIYEEQPLLF